jgi:uncharacterized protein (TIGR02145 family)
MPLATTNNNCFFISNINLMFFLCSSIMTKLKLLFAVAALFLGIAATTGQDVLKINLADDQSVTTPINESLRIGFAGDSALVKTADGETSHQLQDVNSLSFNKEEGAEQYFTNMVFYKDGEVTYRSNLDLDGDSIKFPVYVSPEGYIEINGVKWAVANVDAPGTFAENQWNAGMLYQWNRPIGWSSTDPMVNHQGGTTWDASMPAGNVWEESNSVCPAGYRLPTKAEMDSLVTVTAEWGTLSGTTGWFFGTSEPRLFLPAPGSRVSTNGQLVTPNEYGNYRSGTSVETTSGWGSQSLQFLKIGNVVMAPVVMLDAYNTASSIRCVVAENTSNLNFKTAEK